MSGKKVTQDDLILLRAEALFSDDDQKRALAERALASERRDMQKDQGKPEHRPEDGDEKKRRAREFVRLVRANWGRIKWDRKDAQVGALMKQAAQNGLSASHARESLLRGIELLIEDRMIDAEPLDEFHLHAARDLIHMNRRTNSRTARD